MLPLTLCLLLILMISCGSQDRFIGTYRTEVKDSPTQAETVLELKANEDGTWRVGDEKSLSHGISGAVN